MKILAIILFLTMYVLMTVFMNWRIWIVLATALIFIVSGILPMSSILSAINWNVLLMIGGTMVLVDFFIQSRMPNLIADWLLDKAKNVMWVIIFMSLFSGFISAFVDNVATVLMVAPVGIAVCRKLKISPIPMILSIAVSSNLQGAATLVGDTTSIMLGAYAKMDFLAFFWMEGKPGIFFAVDFLGTVTKRLLDTDFQKVPEELVKGKDVIVIGGGDTGNDCVGTCVRLGAKSITQLEMMPEPPSERQEGNPWPEWPRVLKTDYGQEEAIHVFGADPRVYQTTVKEFIKDKKGHLKEAVLISLFPEKDETTGRIRMVPAEGTEKTVKAQLVLIAAGFLGSETYVTESFGVETDGRTNVKTKPGEYSTSKEKIFVAGDMHRGQSLVVWAIAEGRGAARAVDEALMGYSNL